MYLYTLLKQDGSTKELAESTEKVDFNQLRKWLNCQAIEIIPEAYHQLYWQNATVYGDEEGRFLNKNITNTHTRVHENYDCVGDLVLEEELK